MDMVFLDLAEASLPDTVYCLIVSTQKYTKIVVPNPWPEPQVNPSQVALPDSPSLPRTAGGHGRRNRRQRFVGSVCQLLPFVLELRSPSSQSRMLFQIPS